VTIGLDAVELQPKPWPYRLPVLGLAATPSLDALVPVDPEVVGDLKSLLAAVAEFAPAGSGWGERAALAFRREVDDALNIPSRGLSPQRTMEVARALLPRDTIATCDAGASRLLVVQKWQSYAPREFLASNGLGSMGYAIPAALAARLAHPDRTIAAFTGDGGFMMALAELQTAARENLPILVVVFDDEEIGLIRVKQEIKGIAPYGVGLGGVDWEKLARGLGADAAVVDTEQGLSNALSAALTPRNARPSSPRASTLRATLRNSTHCASSEQGALPTPLQDSRLPRALNLGWADPSVLDRWVRNDVLALRRGDRRSSRPSSSSRARESSPPSKSVATLPCAWFSPTPGAKRD
jgi:hypothetical protein